MPPSPPGQPPALITDADRRRRRREIILIIVIIGVLALLTFIENHVISFGPRFSISSTVLMFIIININLLLLLLLIFLVFRNVVKLLYERRRGVMGAKLRTRLVAAFVALTLLPTGVLFFFSLNFITNSIEFWFNIPIEQALQNALTVGQRLYGLIETQNRLHIERINRQVETRDLLAPDRREELERYISMVQREFTPHGVEIYAADGRRLASALGQELSGIVVPPVSLSNLRTGVGESRVSSVSRMTAGGELNRIIGAIPFAGTVDAAKAFVVVDTLVPTDLTESLVSISRGVEEYGQIKLLKNPIRATYYMILSIVALLVVFCAIWFGFFLAKSISIPIKLLADGTRRVAEGDLSFSIPMSTDDEIGSLVASFNKMTKDLRASRQQLELSAQMLRERNAEIETRRRHMEIVLQNVSTGVIALAPEGMVTTINKSAESMLGVRFDEVGHQDFRKLLTGDLLQLAEHLLHRSAASPGPAVEAPLRITVGGTLRALLFRVTTPRDQQGNILGFVVVFDDLTDQEKAQRMAAWREVARRIAHEVKNPLTPISLSAQRLQRRYAATVNDPVFGECIRMIIDHTETIRNLVNEFSKFARFPAARLEKCELLPIVEEAIALYREGYPDVTFSVGLSGDPVPLDLDRQQIKQVISNLVDNAIAAMSHQGEIRIDMTFPSTGGRVRLELADTGPGIPDSDKARLFEPYFSTKKTGMGLGLAIVSGIIADHNATIRVRDNAGGGTRFIIKLPA